MDTAKPVTGSSCHLGKCLRKINTARQKGEKSKWILGSKPETEPCRFFHFPLSCIQAKTHLNTMEEEDSGKEMETEKAKVESWKKRTREVWVVEKKKKKARKWNKNRLMMELVSRWGSPLTSEAPHSLAYPSPEKRRGHTTDLSDCQGSSARPTLSLSVWSWRGQASKTLKGNKALLPSLDDRAIPDTSELDSDELPASCHIRPAGFFLCVTAGMVLLV